MGSHCDVLAFTAAERRSGYVRIQDGANTSSWGASVLYSEVDQRWHMWVTEMINHCGLNAWQSNSRIVHAISNTAFGEYEFVDEVMPVFAANPAVVRGENGEWIMLFEHSDPPPCNFSICKCYNGSTTKQCNAAQAAKDCDYNKARWPSWLSYAWDANGPWSTPEIIPVFRDTGDQGDFNISPIIFGNGSALFMYRWGGGEPYESHLRLGQAGNWRDVSSYTIDNSTDIFPGLPTGGFEDPFLYRDHLGGFHALVHSMVGEKTCHRLAALDGRGSCGAHIFSTDGIHWHMHATSGAYTGAVHFAADLQRHIPAVDVTVIRRERPYVLFKPGKCGPDVFEPCGEPLAVLTAAMYPPEDGSFTLLQPLMHKLARADEMDR